MSNKEFGSDFHLCLDDKFLQFKEKNIFCDNKAFSLFFSGCSAIYSLLKFGINKHGWKKVYFPSYYCHGVVGFVSKLKIEICYYEFNPFLDIVEKDISVKDVRENVIINVSFFGVNKLKLSKYKNVVVIDDLSHD